VFALRHYEKRRKRVIYENGAWKSFTPCYARWPFEAHVYPKRHVSSIVELGEDELVDLADALKKTLCAFKNVLEKPMPYIMVMHQAPPPPETPLLPPTLRDIRHIPPRWETEIRRRR